MFYQHFNLPVLPVSLVTQALSIANKIQSTNEARGVYRRYPVTSDILVWCQENILSSIQNNFKIGIQVFSGQPEYPHTDGKRGVKALNFLIDAGGDNVETVWFQEQGHSITRQRGYIAPANAQLEELCRTCFVEHTWQIVQTDIIHTVENVSRPRIALSIGLEDDEFNKFIQTL
jgi:hypothetical protein